MMIHIHPINMKISFAISRIPMLIKNSKKNKQNTISAAKTKNAHKYLIKHTPGTDY